MREQATKNRTYWDRSELVSLACDWAALEGDFTRKVDLYDELAKRCPGRSAESIRARIRYPAFSTMLDEARRRRGAEAAGESAAGGEELLADPTGSRWKSERLESLDLSFLAQWSNGVLDADEIRRGLRDDPQAAVDKVQEVLFPARATSGSSRVRKTVRLAGLKGRLLKRRLYQKLQKEYRKNGSTAARSVIEDTWRNDATDAPSLEEVLPFWRDLLGKESTQDTREYPPPECVHWGLLERITSDDVTRALRGVKGVAGPDGLTWRVLRGANPEWIGSLMGVWQAVARCPSACKEGITTLIPKVLGTRDPSKFRPITVTSCLVRLFHRILARRFDSVIPISEMQRGFRPGDGLGNNISLLQAIVKECTFPDLVRPLSLCYVDVKKAFDSVSHYSILKVLPSVGVPAPLCDYVANLYSGSTTRLRIANQLSDRLPVRQGVKQGDPMSCFLFNLVIDQCVKKLDESLGVALSDEVRVNHIAFADDVVLLAESPGNLGRLFSRYAEELGKVGLEVNPAKCASVNITVHKRKAGRRWVVNPDPIVQYGGSHIPPLAADETYKYLGVYVGVSRRVEREHLYTQTIGSLNEWLQRVTDAPLKPQQRMQILRVHLLPKLHHSLVLGDPAKGLLVRLDVLLRRAVSKWLHLPHGTTTGYFHARVGDGGLGVASFSELREAREKRLSKFLGYEARVSHWLLNQSRWGERHLRFLRPVPSRPPQTLPSSSQTGVSRRGRLSVGPDTGMPSVAARPVKSFKEKLYESVDGRGLRYHDLVPQAHQWLTSNSVVGRSGAQFVRGILLRMNLVPTPARRCRIGLLPSDTCPHCGPGHRATLGHVMQSCALTHGLRVKRHNLVAKYVAWKLRYLGFLCREEPIIPIAQTFCKPDLVAWRDGQAYVVDAAITGDGWDPDGAHEEKVRKYDCPEVTRWAKSENREATVYFGSATLNWRGGVSPASAGFLRALGFTNRDFKILSCRTLDGGWAIWRMFRDYGGCYSAGPPAGGDVGGGPRAPPAVGPGSG